MKLLTLIDDMDDIYCINNILENIDYVPVSHERHWISIFSKFDVIVPKDKDEQKKNWRLFLENLTTSSLFISVGILTKTCSSSPINPYFHADHPQLRKPSSCGKNVSYLAQIASA